MTLQYVLYLKIHEVCKNSHNYISNHYVKVSFIAAKNNSSQKYFLWPFLSLAECLIKREEFVPQDVNSSNYDRNNTRLAKIFVCQHYIFLQMKLNNSDFFRAVYKCTEVKDYINYILMFLFLNKLLLLKSS